MFLCIHPLHHSTKRMQTQSQIAGATMVAARTVGVAVFSALVFVMAAGVAYAIAMDGFSSCLDPGARWMQAVLAHFLIDMAVMGAWIVYKESSWIKGAVFMALFFWVGSVVTCGYVVLQFYKLSPEESSTDPLHFVLVRHEKGDVVRHMRGPSLLTARIIFGVLYCLILGISIYALIVDGSPFRAKIFTPCMVASLIDIYIHVVVLSVWVAYKESSWITALFWIVLLICFGSITTCAYIVWQLFYLSPQQPISLIIFNNNNRDLQSSDPLLMAHPDV